AYLYIPTLRDLAQAEHWYRRSLGMCEEHQRQGQARCLGQLGSVAYEHFLEAYNDEQSEEVLLRHLNDALQLYNQALELTPADAVIELSIAHNQLGIIYSQAGDLGRALSHYRESIRYKEISDNLFGAAQTRYNVAILLVGADRFADAWEYAYAALRNYETYGDRAAEQIQRTRELIAKIEQLIQEQGG